MISVVVIYMYRSPDTSNGNVLMISVIVVYRNPYPEELTSNGVFTMAFIPSV